MFSGELLIHSSRTGYFDAKKKYVKEVWHFTAHIST